MPTSQADPWRQAFHITPPVGLLNDPNGLIYWNGAYHVFFQWNPQGCSHENKAWAHVSSHDLVNWQWLPTALSPDESYETHGCYSGSAIAADQSLFLFYTGNVRTAQGGRKSSQCLARSFDGLHFEKLGPVIAEPAAGYTNHFRDPKVWRGDGQWWMVLGAQTTDLSGTVLLLRSPDLKTWSVCASLLSPGEHGYMCECPDLFSLDGHDLLLFCEQDEQLNGQGERVLSNIAGYVFGRLDKTAKTFQHGSFERLDQGRDFYAPQTFETPDGRRLLFGWMGLPEQTTAPTTDFGWMHCLTVPRELSWIEGRLCQEPAAELQALRKTSYAFRNVTANGSLVLPDVSGAAFELDLRISDDLQGSWFLDVRSLNDERTTLGIDRELGRITLETVGGAAFSPLEQGPTILGSSRIPHQGVNRVRVFVDRSSIEVFINAGAISFSARIYPSERAEGVRLRSNAGVRFFRIDFWPL